MDMRVTQVLRKVTESLSVATEVKERKEAKEQAAFQTRSAIVHGTLPTIATTKASHTRSLADLRVLEATRPKAANHAEDQIAVAAKVIAGVVAGAAVVVVAGVAIVVEAKIDIAVEVAV